MGILIGKRIVLRESFHKFCAGFPTDDNIKNKILGTKIFYFKNATKMVLENNDPHTWFYI